ncbi:immunoglobulin-like domain-containing protein [Psychrobium sp. nBUS_13]|uniref:immunoglobulin-like domain-containing protein n=1 Tax=Psychrobium sp. nBUS_13 TaxID=3395319 RepID=UPI003EB79E57
MKYLFFLLFFSVFSTHLFASDYTYDSLSRLTQVTYDNGTSISYQYDAAGNLLSVTTVDNTDTDGDGITDNDDVDDDNDNIPDEVEKSYGLNPLDATDANGDLDNDGLINLEEYNLGTSLSNEDTDGDGSLDGVDPAPLDNMVSLTLGDINFADTNLEACLYEGYQSSTKLNQITDLNCFGKGIEDLSGLENLTSLYSISIMRNNVSDLSPILQLIELRHLYLSENNIADFSQIESLPLLTALYINENNISDLSFLAPLTALDTLNIANNPIQNIEVLSSFSSLQWLDVTNTHITDISPLKNLSKLSYLEINTQNITNKELLGNITSLETLILWNSELIDITFLSFLNNLTYLNLTNNQIIDITPLANLIELNKLDISSNNVKDITAILAWFELPDELYLSGNPIGCEQHSQLLNKITAQGIQYSLDDCVIPDTILPIITLIGESDIMLGVGEVYTDSGATAIDNVDGDISTNIQVTGEVDTNSVGSYTLTYNVSDEAGNAAMTVTRTVSVVDKTRPLITLIGEADITLGVGEVYIDSGATAIDNVDGNISTNIQVTGEVDTYNVGSYTLTYNVSDEAGNEAISVTRTVSVIDNMPPVLSVPSNIVVFVNELSEAVISHVKIQSFLSSASAIDNVDGNIELITHNAPQHFSEGTTTVTFSAKDKANRISEAQATITISLEPDTEAPTFDEIAPITVEATAELTDIELPIPTFTDQFPEQVVITADKHGGFPLGETVITWSATDSSNNTSIATQTIIVEDTTAPEFDANLPIQTINAAGLNTLVMESLLNVPQAFDLVDGDVDVTLAQEYSLKSGVNEVTWKAKDNSGNEVFVNQQLHINPNVEFSVDVYAEAGGNATVAVHLSGNAATYPVVVSYQVGGTALSGGHSISNGKLIIEQGTTASLPINVYDNGTLMAGDEIELLLTQATNAVIGEKDQIIVTVIDNNEAPMVSLVATQSGQQSNVVFNDDGNVTIFAELTDLNQEDIVSGHRFHWAASNSNINDLDSDDNTFTFDPRLVSAGSYNIELTVTENRDNQPLSSSIDISLIVKDSNVILEDTIDSDGDGISDKKEGTGDSDNDGIADYLDNDSNTSRLPIADDNEPLQTLAGYTLSVGQEIISSEGGRVENASLTFEQLTINHEEADNTEDIDYKPVSYPVDFEVKGLSRTGEPVPVVIPLPDGAVVTENSVYRKYSEELGWHNFVGDTSGNTISSTVKVNGNCPSPLSELYSDGLTVGDECVRVILVDGGVYDTDGSPNGQVRDPGYIATRNSPPIIIVENTDITVDENSDFKLDASESYDPENDSITFNWQQLSGTNILNNDNKSSIELTAPNVIENEELVFEVSVSDGGSIISKQQVMVNVIFVNELPELKVSASSYTVNEGAQVTLRATATDVDDQTINYNWKQISGATATLSSLTSSEIKVTMPDIKEDMILTFEVIVGDGVEQVTQQVSIDVKAKKDDSGGSMGCILYFIFLLMFTRRRKLLSYLS